MAVNVKITVEGDERLADAFEQFARKVADLRPQWPAVAGKFYEHVRATFDSQGFGTWKPLSSRYAAWKRRHFPSPSILEATGNLRRSLTSQSTPNSIYRAAPLSLELGTTVRYARLHQFGATLKTGPRKSKKAPKAGARPRKSAPRPVAVGILPARPPIIITPELNEAIGTVVQLGLGKEAANLGFTVR